MSEVVAWSSALVALIWLGETTASRLRSRERSEVKRATVSLGHFSDVIPVLFIGLGATALLTGVGSLPSNPVALLVQPVGLIIALGAEVLGARARMELGEQHVAEIEVWAEQRLVARGVFSFVRHPIYLATIALGFGLGLGLWSWALLLADLVAALPILYWTARQEEQLLVERFGDSYLEYQLRVPMLRPWPRTPRTAAQVVDQADVAEQE